MSSDQTDSSTCDSDVHSSSQVDVKELDKQIIDSHQDHQCASPVYWSASQLLSKLDNPSASTFHNRSYGFHGQTLNRGHQRRSEHIQRKLSLNEGMGRYYRNTVRNSSQHTTSAVKKENQTPKMDQRHSNLNKALDQEYMNRTPRTNPRHFSRTTDQVNNKPYNQKHSTPINKQLDEGYILSLIHI